jgi:hypothetical protein
MSLQSNAWVLTLEWYIPDNWYGTRKRLVLSLDGENGFKNASEANRYRSLFIKYINSRFKKPPVKRNDGKEHREKFKGEQTEVGHFGSFATYIYCGAGPSYSCDNILITVSTLQEWLAEWEKSDEGQQKARDKAYRETMKQWKQSRSSTPKAMSRR